MLGGGGWNWVEVEMSWVEMDGARWSWVHGLVIPILFECCILFVSGQCYHFIPTEDTWKTNIFWFFQGI